MENTKFINLNFLLALPFLLCNNAVWKIIPMPFLNGGKAMFTLGGEPLFSTKKDFSPPYERDYSYDGIKLIPFHIHSRQRQESDGTGKTCSSLPFYSSEKRGELLC